MVGKEPKLDLSKYRRPPYMSNLAKELKKLLPPREATVGFFLNLLDDKQNGGNSEIVSYGPIIFGSILESVEKMMINRESYLP